MNKYMPCEIALGWSRAPTALSYSIRYLTRPGWAPMPIANWSHMFLLFRFPDGSGVIHEALMSEGWCAKPATKLSDWLAKDPRNAAELRWLPISTADVEAIYARSCDWIGTKSYAHRQILAFAVAESLLGRWLGLSIACGPEEVICSEGASQLVGEIANEWDLRQDCRQSWDSVSPQAAYNVLIRKLDG